jgi:predicted metal-dependent peptidase
MSVWTDMTNEQRVTAVHFDFMRHDQMALLAGIVTMGSVYFKPVGTACTNGLDCIYDPEFWRALDRLEARFVVGHENFHKALKHCINYEPLVKKYPVLSNYAMDYVVNGLLHQADPGWNWMKPPKSIKILLDAKYYNMSFPQVLRDLLKDGAEEPEDPDGPEGDDEQDGGDQPGGKEGKGGGKRKGKGGKGKLPDGQVLDKHEQGKEEGAAKEKIETDIDNSLRQGEILAKANRQRSGHGTGGLFGVDQIMDRRTNWKPHMLDFVTSTTRGDDIARWSRVNSRIFGATRGRVVLPTLYTETVGHIGLFCDTSGSMVSYYPVLFGEAAHIMESVKPEKVTVIWWDTQVANVQEFTPATYPDIRTLLKPAGGGGTTPQCVADYIKERKLKFQCGIWLTDGYIGNEPSGLQLPQLWGVVENEHFNARTGKTVHIRV